MPPSTDDRLRDILDFIAEIEDVLKDVTLDSFAADRRTRLLTERLLEIVCEASRRIPETVKAEAPEIDWQRMVDVGNRLRHAYHATDAGILWDIIANHLPPLKAFVRARTRATGA